VDERELLEATRLIPVIAQLAGQDVPCESDNEETLEETVEGGVCQTCWPVCWPGWADGKPSAPAEEHNEVVPSGRPSVESNEFLDIDTPKSLKADDYNDLDNVQQRGTVASCDLFSDSHTAPAIGGLVVSTPHSEHLLPPEVVLYEPERKLFGVPFEHGKPGRRLIFLNTKLSKTEQEGLQALHKALEDEGVITSQGDAQFPLYVRLHALRILQQAKFNVNQALSMFLIHLNMRVKWFPLTDNDLLEDLKKGLMYWHGRDKQCHPCLVWKLGRISQFKNKDAAIKVCLFVMEYGVRYALVPGRVENWILLVDLENVGFGQSNSLSIAKNAGTILESVFCGRNYQTKIMSLPWVIRSTVNSLIPDDKREKVEFVADNARASTMLETFEPHQIEEAFGGSCPNLAPQETYPFKFFPNATGSTSSGDDKSLHMFTDRQFHEGALWDTSSDHVKQEWVGIAKQQSLSPSAVEELKELGVDNVKPCQDLQTWFRTVNPEEADRRGFS